MVSQKHGFVFENMIRERFQLPSETNNTNTHDIPKNQNIFDDNENISIKTTKDTGIMCGDILRFFSYNMNEKNTILVIKYNQIGSNKCVEEIFEIL